MCSMRGSPAMRTSASVRTLMTAPMLAPKPLWWALSANDFCWLLRAGVSATLSRIEPHHQLRLVSVGVGGASGSVAEVA